MVLRSRPPQNVKIGIFTSQSCSDGKKNVQKGTMHIHSYCFKPNLNHYCFFAVLVDVAVVIA